jgi:hypothetical protein
VSALGLAGEIKPSISKVSIASAAKLLVLEINETSITSSFMGDILFITLSNLERIQGSE